MNHRKLYPGLPDLPRRRFVQGLALGGAVAGLGVWPGRVAARPAAGAMPELRGREFALTIGETPLNVTGRPRMATAINGSVPGPVLRWREGDRVRLRVTNRLPVSTSIHWHGIILPYQMDGVPGVTFPGIAPGETFTYEFDVRQAGTYWYHSHSRFQEQTGLYGPLIIEPRDADPVGYDREHVVMLNDWSDEDPESIFRHLKQQSDYYNYGQRTLGDFFDDVSRLGWREAVKRRQDWGGMRMSPTDISDVTGATYTYLMNGQAPAGNWTGLFRPGEKVRLRFINGSAMTFFDVRIPGLKMTVVQADGQNVEPVSVDEFRIGVAETYDVIVQPRSDEPYTVFAQAMDRSGYARGTLAPRAGMHAPVPALDPRPERSLADLGMGGGAMVHDMHSDAMPMPGMAPSDSAGQGMAMSGLKTGPAVAMRAMHPQPRLDDPGNGLRHNGRRVLTYADLRSLIPGHDPREPEREITLHLTGNMERYIWGFDGQKFAQEPVLPFHLGERLRITLINDTMMEHPIHLHGMWSELETGAGDYRPYKHTISVKPGEKLSYRVSANAPGNWAYHCHLLYHMEAGMFRKVVVA